MIPSQPRAAYSIETRRLAKSLVIGAIGTLIDGLILGWLVEQFSVVVIVANLFSYSVGMIVTFSLNRTWAYSAARRQTLWTQLGRFVAVNGIGLVLNTVLVALGTHLLAGHRAYLLAKIAASGVVFGWNFSANRWWTFNSAVDHEHR